MVGWGPVWLGEVGFGKDTRRIVLTTGASPVAVYGAAHALRVRRSSDRPGRVWRGSARRGSAWPGEAYKGRQVIRLCLPLVKCTLRIGHSLG